MGVREKSLRGNRKKSGKQQQQQQHNSKPSSASAAAAAAADCSSPLGKYEDAAMAAAIAGGYCREEQVEEILLRHIDSIYKEAISRLTESHDDDVALHAVLRNGHCYGTADTLTNIIDNATVYINSSKTAEAAAAAAVSDSEDDYCGTPPPASAFTATETSSFSFSDTRHLVEYSLAGMICLLQEIRPELNRMDAMWSLLMCDLDIGQARRYEVPQLPSSLDCCGEFGCSGGCGGVDKQPSFAKRLTISSAMKTFLARNNAIASSKPESCRTAASSESQQEQSHQDEEEEEEETSDAKDCEVVSSVLERLENMSLEEEKGKDEIGKDPKREMILNAVDQIRDLEMKVSERKEWAQKTAMQAALKLGADLTELKILRMEREDNQRIKKGKQTLEESTLKRLSEMENALRKASSQVDCANAIVKKLDAENAEIRAEMEASKLSASESATAYVAVTKREKRCMKRLSAWEKQKAQLHKEIEMENRKITQMQHDLNQFREAHKEAEVRRSQIMKAKEEAMMQVEEERRAKEAAEVRSKRNQESLRQKFELDFQRHRDDIKRLEEHMARVSSSLGCTQARPVSSSVSPECGRVRSNMQLSQKPDGDGKMSSGPHIRPESSETEVLSGRKCLLCMKNDALVVLLPCAHQILCINCNEDHEKRAKSCPNCNVRIKERIRVYGASS